MQLSVRSILAKLSGITGYSFDLKVDTCGGNMWVWRRTMKAAGGLELIKSGTFLTDVPPNWKDHLIVVKGQRARTVPQFIKDFEPDERTEAERLFDDLSGQRPKIELDSAHRRLIKYLTEDNRTGSWWDPDHWMLVTHTFQLKRAHGELDLRGIFSTISKDDEDGTDRNCFAFPMRRGAWVVRRYGLGVAETEAWSQDAAGYTRCMYNHDPDLATSAKSFGGIELTKGGYQFRELEIAINAAEALGAKIDLPKDNLWARGRQAWLKPHKDGNRLIVQFERKDSDVLEGWVPDGKIWTRIYNANVSAPVEQESGNYDDLVRHLISEGSDDFGWVIRGTEGWNTEPLQHVRAALKAQGLNSKESEILIGQCVNRAWKLVNIPFREEYPGDRQWNRNAAQLRYLPNPNKDNLRYPHWKRILDHCGLGLDNAVENDGWCKANGIMTGSDYLKLWIASLFQFPLRQLPYLFMYGPQNSGKSIFHEAIELLMTRGYQRGENALKNSQGFNGELEGAIACVIEEVDLSSPRGTSSDAYNRMKDFVTSLHISIHPKGKTPYLRQNSTHWIHCANNQNFCPIFPGDSRITMINVPDLDPMDMIPKTKLVGLLQAEASDFLSAVLSLEIPEATGRLNLPVISTEQKLAVEEANQTIVEQFFTDNAHYCPGNMVLYSEVWDKFQNYLEPGDVMNWTQKRFGREIPQKFPKGRNRKDCKVMIGNLGWEPPTPEESKRRRLTTQSSGSGQIFLVPDENDKRNSR
jgi:hypothetical protein